MNVNRLEHLLRESQYDETETTYLVNGFRHGFDLEYQGPTNRQDRAQNIPFRNVGSAEELWSKLMSEVEVGRYAGPFHEIPFKNYIQSPIGLVLKAGNKTRLIFHLSYDFAKNKSVNACTLQELCTVKYNDLDEAVRLCLKKGNGTIFSSKPNLSSAFRMVPTRPRCWNWTVMEATDPEMGEIRFFIDKNLPFGASISCLVFQRFSNGLKHIFEYTTGVKLSTVNYLDDFLFLQTTEQGCNDMVRAFIELCKFLGVPIALEKTEWANTRTVFLGILIDGVNKILCVPEEKWDRAVNMLKFFIHKKKATVKEMEKLAGYLNFLNKTIHPGRVFTRRMYAKFSKTAQNLQLKRHHHVRFDNEFKDDCKMWLSFLTEGNVELKVCQPWIDFEDKRVATRLEFYTDASGSDAHGGFGGFYKKFWMAEKWDVGFLMSKRPSIEFLELFAMAACVLKWLNQPEFHNSRVEIYCDNQTVCGNLNNTTSGCKNCMRLLRLIVKQCLENNCCIFAVYLKSRDNGRADALSRGQFKRFWTLCKKQQETMNAWKDTPPLRVNLATAKVLVGLIKSK